MGIPAASPLRLRPRRVPLGRPVRSGGRQARLPLSSSSGEATGSGRGVKSRSWVSVRGHSHLLSSLPPQGLARSTSEVSQGCQETGYRSVSPDRMVIAGLSCHEGPAAPCPKPAECAPEDGQGRGHLHLLTGPSVDRDRWVRPPLPTHPSRDPPCSGYPRAACSSGLGHKVAVWGRVLTSPAERV